MERKKKDYNIVYRNKPTKPMTVDELFGIKKEPKKEEKKEEKVEIKENKMDVEIKKEEVVQNITSMYHSDKNLTKNLLCQQCRPHSSDRHHILHHL